MGRHLTTEEQVRSQASPCGNYGGQIDTQKVSSPSISDFPCQYHSTIAPYSFIHPPPTLYNIFLPALQFSPVSIIPPLLHTHSFIYHPRCIMFFSQYFSFPLSVSFHHSIVYLNFTIKLAENRLLDTYQFCWPHLMHLALNCLVLL